MQRTKFTRPRKKRISVGSAKAKGRNLQKWVCSKIAELTGHEWGKDQDIESRPMGQTGVDVRMTREVLSLFPFSVECKRQENWSVPSWIEQARRNQIPNTDWLLVIQRNFKDPVVVMDAEAFFYILKHGLK